MNGIHNVLGKIHIAVSAIKISQRRRCSNRVHAFPFIAFTLACGPCCLPHFGHTQGIPPMDAVERLNRFKEESKIRERKQELYSGKSGQYCAHATVYARNDISEEYALALEQFL